MAVALSFGSGTQTQAAVTINFDNFTPGFYDADFLASYGIPNITIGGAPGARGPRIFDLTGVSGFTAPSAPNILYQYWNEADGPEVEKGMPHWLEFEFSPELTSFSLTRVGMGNIPARSFGPWQATFYDAVGVELGNFGESCNEYYCIGIYPPLVFTFDAPPGTTIAKMRLTSWWYASTLRNINVDDFVLTQVDDDVDNWVTIQGTVTYNGTPLCAMVLANGQYMFSCGENQGTYELDVPLDENGEITLFAFVDGLAPFKQILAPWEALDFDIEMELASPDSKTPTVTSTVVESIDNPGWVEIEGTVSLDGIPLCAMVLANGQYMFSCDPYGEYQLTVPLDPNGEITLFVFVDGLQPYKEIISP